MRLKQPEPLQCFAAAAGGRFGTGLARWGFHRELNFHSPPVPAGSPLRIEPQDEPRWDGGENAEAAIGGKGKFSFLLEMTAGGWLSLRFGQSKTVH